ncbi:hypothetical protein, partial [Aneurinibacillus sp. UBA3580]
NQPVDPNNPNPTDPNQQNPDQINPADPNQPASSGRGVAPPEQNDERPGRGNGRGQSGVTNP